MASESVQEQSTEPRLVRVTILSPVSIVVPTYRERDNLPALLARIDALRRAEQMEIEVLVMDDDSRDGSAEYVESSGYSFARLITRRENRGLSEAVMDGFQLARHPVVVVMDADLSHPPEAIPRMVLALDSGQEFVIGSRYVRGGSVEEDWGFLRWLNSRLATLLARPLTPARDPMAGFFAFRRSLLERAEKLDPIGYKIGLEVMVRCNVTSVGEVPIYFANRTAGSSKLNLRVQLQYVRHLRRLYAHRFGVWFQLASFLAIGLSGVAVNLLVLTGLLALDVGARLALAGGILVSMVSNFLLNRRTTFSHARDRAWMPQFGGFVIACSIGAGVNFLVANAMLSAQPELAPQVAALVGIAAGTFFNFLANRYFVFRARHESDA